MSKKSEKPYFSPYTIIVDTREQNPYQFTGHTCNSKRQYRPLIVRTIVDTLTTGDYSLDGFQDRITIERKSLTDAYGTFSANRDRFERELLRMAKFENSHLVVEADWPTLLRRRCPDCCGLGKLIPKFIETITVEFARDNVHKLLMQDFALVLREWKTFQAADDCPRCDGTGALLPTDHTKFLPKAFFETVIAWKVRFPSIQWEFCYSRAFAEKTTLRILERFWNDEQDRLKLAGKQTLEPQGDDDL